MELQRSIGSFAGLSQQTVINKDSFSDGQSRLQQWKSGVEGCDTTLVKAVQSLTIGTSLDVNC
jgi:hypothetical protein